MNEAKQKYALKVRQCGPRVTTRRLGNAFTALEVENPGDDRVTIREIEVVDIDGACGSAGERLTVRAPLLLRPRARKILPIPLALPDDTAPGTYRFSVEVSGAVQEVQINVAVRARIRLSPAVLHIDDVGKSSHQVIVQNLGNVDATVSGSIAIPLDDELIVCRSLRGAMGVFDERSAEEVTLDHIVAEGFRQAREALHGAIVGVQFQETTVPANTEQVVTVTVDTPKTLDPRSRYTAAIPVLNATLGVSILPRQIGQFATVSTSVERGGATTAKKTAAKKTAAKKTAAKKATSKQTAAKPAAARSTTAKKSSAAKAAKQATPKKRQPRKK